MDQLWVCIPALVMHINKWKKEYRKPVFSEIQVQTTITLFNFWHLEARYVL
jgi:hypothetical protein